MLGDKWGRKEMEKSGEPVWKAPSFSAKGLRKELEGGEDSRKGCVI